MSQPHEEVRVIGPVGSVAIVAGSMIGIGIFLIPPVVAQNVGSLAMFFGCWIVGAAMAFAGSTAYAELGAMYPQAGGDYVFLRNTFGRSVAFAAGWVLFLGIFCGSLAAMSVALCQYQINAILSGLWGIDVMNEVAFAGITWSAITGVAIALGLTGLNVVGTKLSASAQVVITGVPIAVLTGFSLWAFAESPATTTVTTPDVSFRNLATAMSAVYFAFAGWNAAAYVAGEVENPGRNLPIGLLGGTALVAVLYLVLCGGFVAGLGLDGLRETGEAGSALAGVLGGQTVNMVMTGAIAVALFGSLNSTVLGGARIAFEMAHDRILPETFGRRSEAAKTPAAALWLQFAVATLLILSGTFETLVEMTSIAMMLLASLAVVALFVLRRRLPDFERPYRATGYPLVPAFFVLASIGVVGLEVWDVIAPTDPTISMVDRLLPVAGLTTFVVLLLGHSGWVRFKGTPDSQG
jgi:APA family basic amino acid/polyamine antiporter